MGRGEGGYRSRHGSGALSALTRQRAAEAAGVLPPVPQLHHATTGWRRAFLSPGDAQQYSAGYGQWPDEMPEELRNSAPYRTGWFDHESDALDRA